MAPVSTRAWKASLAASTHQQLAVDRVALARGRALLGGNGHGFGGLGWQGSQLAVDFLHGLFHVGDIGVELNQQVLLLHILLLLLFHGCLQALLAQAYLVAKLRQRQGRGRGGFFHTDTPAETEQGEQGHSF